MATTHVSAMLMRKWVDCFRNCVDSISRRTRSSFFGATMDFTWVSKDCGRKRTTMSCRRKFPLIVSVPGQKIIGAKCDSIVELVDVFPTLADVANLKMLQELEGLSFKPLLESPQRDWKRAAFSQYPRSLESNRHSSHGDIMGKAIRTKRYRYVEWRVWETKKVVARELYDHDSDTAEMRNIVDLPENAKLVDLLSKQLMFGWIAGLPE